MPFGEETHLVPPEITSTNTRHFTGHERDGESGLDYMVARYYSSSLGRFLAVDPILSSGLRRFVSVDLVTGRSEDPQSWNRYTYVSNNPLGLVDPDGMLQVDANLAKLYPKAAAAIRGMGIRSAREYRAYKAIGGKAVSKAQISITFTPGNGPRFRAEKFYPSQNRVAWYHNADNVGLDVRVLEAFENDACGSATELEALVKHETAHYIDELDGREDSPEPGDEFEERVYGQRIGNDIGEALTYERANSEMRAHTIRDSFAEGRKMMDSAAKEYQRQLEEGIDN